VGILLGPGEEDDACRSNYINSSYYCDQAPKLIGSNIKETAGEKCGYTFGEADYSKCYYHADGKALCKKGTGDLTKDWDLVSFLSRLIQYRY
jgi:hypothetical protein